MTGRDAAKHNAGAAPCICHLRCTKHEAWQAGARRRRRWCWLCPRHRATATTSDKRSRPCVERVVQLPFRCLQTIVAGGGTIGNGQAASQCLRWTAKAAPWHAVQRAAVEMPSCSRASAHCEAPRRFIDLGCRGARPCCVWEGLYLQGGSAASPLLNAQGLAGDATQVALDEEERARLRCEPPSPPRRCPPSATHRRRCVST